ncbi:antA/AntB antirepressor family protein [Capnocytophaga sp.]|uniref:antA/AntB antirepressor family protein n=1 Tax=Capnocytophaga sp. TaxID=44737 RepID=UPI0026DB4D9A|nr:antA/AntB antirepressor family protein [Capnocytophaga sp.]MDO5104602.1 antA/AntB antirepressor family protein [Capnocytophaga sp.]
MINLQITKTENGKQAVQCSQLYRALGLDESNFARWVQQNILNNRWAIEGEDYTLLTRQMQRVKEVNSIDKVMPLEYTPNKYRNRSKAKDYVLTLDFAKRLAMMTKTEQGEKVRLYFLECEKVAHAKTELINAELMNELQAYRGLFRIAEIRKESNRQARQYREQLRRAKEVLNPFQYVQLKLNF